MRRYEVLRKERFSHKYESKIEDNYFLDQSAMRLSSSQINKILKEHCINVGVSKEPRGKMYTAGLSSLLCTQAIKEWFRHLQFKPSKGHYDTQIKSNYLRGLETETILEVGRINHRLINYGQ